MTHNKCLLCYRVVEESGEEFHRACSRRLFSALRPPPIGTTLAEIESLAKEHATNRVAVAGVQPKLSIELKPSKARSIMGVQRVDDSPRLTVGIHGQYLLKAPTSRYPYMVELEDLTMHLAEICKIKTAAHGLIRLASGELTYITRRFDRNGTRKFAQEDLCQISELLTEYKYNSSMEKIGKLIIGYSANSGLDAVSFLEIALFSFLTGNADMHTKNFSLLTGPDGLRTLSPAYDLLSTIFLVPEDPEECALSINGKKSKLKLDDFIALAKTLKIPTKVLEKTISRFTNFVNPMRELIDQSFVSDKLKIEYKSPRQSG